MRTGNYVADTTGGTGPYSISGEGDVTASHENSPPPRHAPTQRGWGSALGQFQEEFDMVKSVATGAVMSTVVGTLQELIRQNIPSMAAHFDQAAKRIAKKWGAEPSDSATTHQTENGGGHVQPVTASPSLPLSSTSNEPYRQGE